MANITAQSDIYLRVTTSGAVIYIAVYLIIAICCVIGNGLVILSFVYYQTVRKIINNYFLFGLAVADFFTGLIAIPLAVINRLVISEVTCRAFTRSVIFFPAYMFGAVSICHLVAITVDRYIAITKPLRYPVIMTSRKACIILVFLWCFGLSFGALPGMSFGGDPKQWVCELQQYEAPTVAVHNIAASSLLPAILIILIFVYGRIFYIAFLKPNLARNSSSRNRSKESQSRARTRATVTCAIVLGTFTICWLPQSYKYIFETYFQITDLRSLLLIQTSCEMLAYCNSLINPIIYGWRSPHFRRAYKDILRYSFLSSKTNARRNKEETIVSISSMEMLDKPL
ncbi:Adenosine receptor A2a [Holothuria leucospilota]|uniref:Adenosine receptor A2a n=1 Tax=Holothuria leucospilota TaxID=206669 RepID=A0A9Q1H9Q0_HOLLE|nr:Adenosine receptor A2a [Holothuria leucospilota]